MTDWPEYESHKVVRAAKIVGIRTDFTTGVIEALQVRVDCGVMEDFMPSEPVMAMRAKVGDWAMLYPDGFRSVSPAKAFEEGYIRKS